MFKKSRRYGKFDAVVAGQEEVVEIEASGKKFVYLLLHSDEGGDLVHKGIYTTLDVAKWAGMKLFRSVNIHEDLDEVEGEILEGWIRSEYETPSDEEDMFRPVVYYTLGMDMDEYVVVEEHELREVPLSYGMA